MVVVVVGSLVLVFGFDCGSFVSSSHENNNNKQQSLCRPQQ